MLKKCLAIGLRWVIPVGLATGLAYLVAAVLLQRGNLMNLSMVNAITVHQDATEVPPEQAQASAQVKSIEPSLGPRHQLTYEQWVAVLEQEAAVMADRQPDRLNILLGDSLSLWFPSHLLPTDQVWLNQGISGETSYGVLKRVELLDRTKPQTVFLMIGINDLIRGVRFETVLENQREIVRHLKNAHPTARIIVQSILPHGGDRTVNQYADAAAHRGEAVPAWANRLPDLTNDAIRRLNQRLATMAQEEQVEFLDLHPLFVDSQGNLQEKLTTDGLHLSLEGYQVWRSQLANLPAPALRVTHPGAGE